MKLNYKQIICVGFAFFLISMFWQVYDTVIAKILIDSFGLNQTWSGVVMALDNIIAVVLLPVFGKLSDDTNTKWGKRTPYIVVGTVISAALIVVIGIIHHSQVNILANNNIEPVITETVKDLPVFVKDFGNGVFDVNKFTWKTLTEEGTKYYIYEGVFYSTKDAASAIRSIDVAAVRGANIFSFIAFIGVLFFVLLAMASFRTPAVSLMPDVTVKPLRSKANAIINLMGSAGGILALGYLTLLAHDYKSYLVVFIVLAVLMIAALGVFLLTVNEKKLVAQMHAEALEYGIESEEEVKEEASETVKEKMPKDVRKSFILILSSIVFWFMAYNAATSKFSVYATNVLDFKNFSMPLMVAQGAAIISYLPIGMLASKLGRKKTILLGICELFLAFLLGSFATDNSAFLLYGIMALAGIGWATINVNSYPMVVEMAKGSDVGKYTGIYYTASMSAQIITPIFSGFLMDAINMRVLFPYSAIFCALAFTTMLFVRHGDAKQIPEGKSSKEIFEDTINALDD